jgi:hypothetical protein
VLGEVQLGHGDKQHLLQQVVQPHALQDLDHLKGGGDGGVWDVAIICLIFGEQTILSIFEHLSLFQIIFGPRMGRFRNGFFRDDTY